MIIKNRDTLIENGGKDFSKGRELLLDGIEAGLREFDPEKLVLNHIKKYNLSGFEKIYLVSIGKAGIKMAKGILSLFSVYEGIVVSNVEFGGFNSNIKYIRGGHPFPDEKSIEAGEMILDLIDRMGDSDLLIFLISGGGSSLVEYPMVPLKDLRSLTEILILSGLTIDEINTIRKHLSLIKGGGVVKRCKGKILSLIISDVVFDSLSVVASGPTYFDTSTFKDALNILVRYELMDKIPESVKEIIERGVEGKIPETLKRGDERLKNVENVIIGTNSYLCKFLKGYFEKRGVRAVHITSSIQGEAREVAKVFGGISYDTYSGNGDFERPTIFVFGGETTVNVKGNGVGGRNQELTLSVSPFLKDTKSIFISFGTDGIDGNSSSAGAICDSNTIKRAESLGLNYREFLKNNDSFRFFYNLKDTIITGPTGTNLMDIMLLFVL